MDTINLFYKGALVELTYSDPKKKNIQTMIRHVALSPTDCWIFTNGECLRMGQSLKRMKLCDEIYLEVA